MCERRGTVTSGCLAGRLRVYKAGSVGVNGNTVVSAAGGRGQGKLFRQSLDTWQGASSRALYVYNTHKHKHSAGKENQTSVKKRR